MINYLKGKLVDISINKVIIEINGVGYGVLVSQSVLTTLKKDEIVEFFVHTHVREDALDLYGFLTRQDMELFELLLGVSGVGPKSALAIINRGADQVKQAISKADVTFFTTIPRIGKKSGQRIIVDLKSKIGSLKELEFDKEDSETQELIEALKTLGFTRNEVMAIIPKIPKTAKTLEEKISFCLRFLGKT